MEDGISPLPLSNGDNLTMHSLSMGLWLRILILLSNKEDYYAWSYLIILYNSIYQTIKWAGDKTRYAR